MKLNHNSISARLYRWFYMAKEMPQTLCPYFWKLVIMWIFILPISIISAPLIIAKQKQADWFVRIIGGIFIWFLVFVAFLALFPITYFFWGWFSPNTTFRIWQGTGIFIWMLMIVCSAILGTFYLITRYRDKKRSSQYEWVWDDYGDYVRNHKYRLYEEKPNILIEFIKAKYNRYCPKIDWNK